MDKESKPNNEYKKPPAPVGKKVDKKAVYGKKGGQADGKNGSKPASTGLELSKGTKKGNSNNMTH